MYSLKFSFYLENIYNAIIVLNDIYLILYPYYSSVCEHKDTTFFIITKKVLYLYHKYRVRKRS